MTVSKRIEKLLGTLNELSENQLSKVEDFAEFLKTKKRRKRADRASHRIVKELSRNNFPALQHCWTSQQWHPISQIGKLYFAKH